MDEPPEKLPCNTLTAKELLCSKGINNCILEEWERALNTLPRNGRKHFEPDNSWLQNVQIEKGLKNRRDLLNIERVERVSELATAEWLPAQKKALVTKRSGQDWSNFGQERNGSLYLLPEEALFLMETNCLELIWNGLSCSIQQAYEILIDDSTCTLEEYRVYSQLTRYGYRIQRYFYEESDKCNRTDELTIKRKIIVDPENGLRMSDNQPQNKQSARKSAAAKDIPETSSKPFVSLDQQEKDHEKTTVQESVKQTVRNLVDQILCDIESQENKNKPATSGADENNTAENDTNNEDRNRNSKPEIISDETLLGNIKILRDTSCKVSKWPGARIQRNVKQLPKRNDKVSPPEISIIDSNVTGENPRCTDKRKSLAQIDDSHAKKSKHEVIELSDDEIQELPQCMTRMEMLNLLPNIAFQSEISEKISRRYIPHNIRPQRSTYQYNRTMILNMQENDKQARQNCKDSRTNGRHRASHSRSPLAVNNRSALFQSQRPLLRTPSRSFYPVDQMHGTNINLPYAYRFPFNYLPDIYLQNRVTQNVFHNLFVAFGNHGNAVQQRSLTIQMNNFTMPILEGYRTRHFFTENQLRHGFYQNVSWQQRFCQRRMLENAPVHGNVHSVARRRHDDGNSLVGHEIVNRPSFTTRLGANSWTELKRRWSEEKTITIDDEDYKNKSESEEDCTEVQVVKLLNPLVSPRNVSSMTEIFSRLAIIKSAPERIVRRKKSKYKISYNVYSCTHHYRKTNPGQPLYSLVVMRYYLLMKRKKNLDDEA
ncbi:PREDICTED: uncharacterized protein LOC105564262 isoform X2 [Vollenhovia emeryi]|uniref:uncharacterized protein LOC105564262 isoform X2 n=1 Tax=Vollenhovia emeryi TaxID=411798 RepID=UPI0005F376B5|nr:PREDICTED: uncharacterized protein LOC105564262 isoform X2 [Vollenhovia emeryi]